MILNLVSILDLLSKEQARLIAGHKWPGTTEKYIKANSEQQRELINRFFPVFN